MKKNELIAQKALSLVGCGYIMGATGWICTQARLDQQAKQYPQYAESIYKYGPQWMGKPCYDCAQLTLTAAKAAGISLPSGATSQYKSGVYSDGGTKDTIPLNEPGIQLFREEKDDNGKPTGRMAHTGVTVGNGYEVEARGHAYGVVKRKISDGSWTHWKRYTAVAMEDATYPYVAEVVTNSAAGASIWASADMVDKEGGRLVKVSRGERVEVLDDGNGTQWCKVRWGTYAGVMDAKYLVPVYEGTPTQPPEELYTVQVTGLPKAVADGLMADIEPLRAQGYPMTLVREG